MRGIIKIEENKKAINTKKVYSEDVLDKTLRQSLTIINKGS